MELQSSGWMFVGRRFPPCRAIFQVTCIICCWHCAHDGTPEVTLNHIPQQLLHPISVDAGPLLKIHGSKSTRVPAAIRVLSTGCFIPPETNTCIPLPHFLCLELPFFQLLAAQLDLRASKTWAFQQIQVCVPADPGVCSSGAAPPLSAPSMNISTSWSHGITAAATLKL